MNSSFIQNSAASGGGIFNAGLGDCDPGHDCFRMLMYNNTLYGNAAVGGGGGALYWLHTDTVAVVCA